MPLDKMNDKIKESDKRITRKQQEDKGVKALRELISGEELFCDCDFDDSYLRRYVISTRNVEDAFKRFMRFYNLFVEKPDYFALGEPGPMEYQNLIECNFVYALDGKDREGRPLIVKKIGNLDPGVMELTDVAAVTDIWIEWMYINQENMPREGMSIIIDVASLPFKVIKWLTPTNIKAFFERIEGLPMRKFVFHVVNKHFFLSTMLGIIWALIPENLKRFVHFHFDDWESLHKFIDPAVLPVEYQGEVELNHEERNQKLYEDCKIIQENFLKYRPLHIVNIEEPDSD